MIDLQEPPFYEKTINYDENKHIKICLTVHTFKGVEWLSIRKYYQDFDEEWKPGNEGITMPLDLDNAREMFLGLGRILSLAESKTILEQEFKEILDKIYLN
jgi:TPP-dependent indolepyruvate ferredoxin oxidoreductase alpha subunit